MRAIKNQTGSTLMEVVIAVGIAAVSLLIFTSVLDIKNSVVRTIGEKQELLDLHYSMLLAYSKPDVCRCLLDPNANVYNGFPLTFDSTTKTSGIELSSLYSGCEANKVTSPFATRGQLLPGNFSLVRVKNIALKNIASASDVSTNQYVGTLSVDFEKPIAGVEHSPVEMGIRLITKAGDPDTAKSVIGCQVDNGGSNGIVSNGELTQLNVSAVSLSFAAPNGGQLMLSGEAHNMAKRVLVLEVDGRRLATTTANATVIQNSLAASAQATVAPGNHTVQVMVVDEDGVLVPAEYMGIRYVVFR